MGTSKAIFTISRSEFASLPDDAAVTPIDGSEQASFGTLDKTMLKSRGSRRLAPSAV